MQPSELKLKSVDNIKYHPFKIEVGTEVYAFNHSSDNIVTGLIEEVWGKSSRSNVVIRKPNKNVGYFTFYIPKSVVPKGATDKTIREMGLYWFYLNGES